MVYIQTPLTFSEGNSGGALKGVRSQQALGDRPEPTRHLTLRELFNL